ncbi:hypothetical protein BgAZ_302590 [Babesia gibsoni]|uniref:Thioredoxin domain-containing protein n=1 Tax=Babesia gibsoni TaxID=33632 RepID=A0AAD8PDW1_BABGI|nr:hypothetical protein BgAZ_302590 [Babesia gibsoni]
MGAGRERGYRHDNIEASALRGPLLRQRHIQELSWSYTYDLMRNVPLVDHIVMFYIPLNSVCRQFTNIFLALSQQFEDEKKEVKFSKVNCNASDFGENLCRRYNINTVPTVVYVSSLPLQREDLPSDNAIHRLFNRSISTLIDDVKAPHATRYDQHVTV